MGTEWCALYSTGPPKYQGIANTFVQLIGFLRFGPMAGALGERIVFPLDLLALIKLDVKENRDGNSNNCDPSPFSSILSGNCSSKSAPR